MADAQEERPEDESPDPAADDSGGSEDVEPEEGSGEEAESSETADRESETDEEADAEEEEESEPEADPAACRGEAVSMAEFTAGVESGEWLEKDYLFYIEPEGILQGPLLCSRSDEDVPAGLVMTREAWKRRVVFLDDDRNPDRYELSDPKEIGYIKSIHHYMESSREHAKYPWTKKY